MTREERVALVERAEGELPLSLQADLLNLSRSSLYYQPRPHVPKIAENRFKRLSPPEQTEYLQLVELLDRSAVPGSAVSLSRLGELSDKADSYDAIEIPNETSDLDGIANPAEMYQGIWPKAAELRATGELLRRVATITAPW